MSGNSVVFSFKTTNKIQDFLDHMFPKYLEVRGYQLVKYEIAMELVKLEFDHIYLSGDNESLKLLCSLSNHYSPTTINRANSQNLIYIDDSVDVEKITEEIILSKFTSNNQHDFNANFILCSPGIDQKFIETSKKTLKKLFGDNFKNYRGRRLGRIEHENFMKLDKILKRCAIAVGGDMINNDVHLLEPTIIVCEDLIDSNFDEINFDPIIILVEVKSSNEAIHLMNSKFSKLKSLTIFSKLKLELDHMIRNCNSNSIFINETPPKTSDLILLFGGYSKELFMEFSSIQNQVIRKETFLSEFIFFILKFLPLKLFSSWIENTLFRPRKRASFRHLPQICFGIGFIVSFLIKYDCNFWYIYKFKNLISFFPTNKNLN